LEKRVRSIQSTLGSKPRRRIWSFQALAREPSHRDGIAMFLYVQVIAEASESARCAAAGHQLLQRIK
jgi:hypothetical protein